MAALAELPSQPPKRGAERVCAEMEGAWQSLSGLTEETFHSSTGLRMTARFSGTLRAMRDWYEETTGQLLVSPIEQFLEFRPIQRTLEALRACDQEIAAKPIRTRTRIDIRFQRLLTQTALDLCEPWRIWRSGNHPAEWRAWDQRRSRHTKEALTLLNRYTQWAHGVLPQSSEGDKKRQDTRTESWWRQHRAVVVTLQMEVSLRAVTLAWLDATQEFSDEIHREREAILSHASATLSWLERATKLAAAPPIEKCGLISPEERLRAWGLQVESEARRRLPEQAELLIASGRPQWRSMEARAAFQKTFDTYARTPMRAIVERSWASNAAIVREVEQAKEILAYWSQASSATPSIEASKLRAEARHNAITILREQSQIPAQPDQLDASASGAFWIWQEKGLTAFEAEQYGWLNLLRRSRGRAFLDTAVQAGQLKARAVVRRAGRWTSGRADRVLEAIGGRVPTHPTLQPVVRRTTLRDTLSLPAAKSELPALYQRLFELAPVEDRRFLVGREQELTGLTQAIEDWEAGRFAACLMVGARGSGKTSLLNCAIGDALTSRSWIRAAFQERIVTPTALDVFLRKVLNLQDGADLVAAFESEQLILILEESERIYLRKVGGFAAAHHLMHLIHRTASTTLWIIVMNDKSFRVLDAGVDLHRVFSHRINAMSVSRADLEHAILERHRLSGLRLAFAPPPAGDPRVNLAKRWIGLEDSPQKLFFDSLFQQSEGVFRSAFDLWLSSIQRVEGETLRIRQPLDPAFNQFRSELAQEDQLTLLVIQEHGSLTQDELAEVLCEARERSGSRMERLSALGLIEPDPEHPGLRVRPEAQRFVNDLLRRANLT